MFGKLKEKLINWTKKLSEESDELPEEVEAEVKKEKKTASKKVKKEAEQPKEEPKDKEEIEEEPEPEEIEIPEKAEQPKESIFKKFTSKISKVKISEDDFNVYAEELELMLLESNVAMEVVDKIIGELREEIVGKEIAKKELDEFVKKTFKEIIEKILIEPYDFVDKIKGKSQKPFVILFCGVNGTGKTTSIAKIADYLKKKNISCVLAAADTFRAASIEQIQKHGDKLGVKVIAHDYGTDPASVGFDAIKYAQKNVIDCVLIDTAGRMHTATNLLREIEKVARVCKPDLKIFVGESITGNDILEQVKNFDATIGIDGIILSKADIDEKGGTALSVGYVTKKPILYLGVGQEYNQIEPFDKEKFLERLGL